MMLDSEEQKKLLMELIERSSISGLFVEKVADLKKSIREASVGKADDGTRLR